MEHDKIKIVAAGPGWDRMIPISVEAGSTVIELVAEPVIAWAITIGKDHEGDFWASAEAITADVNNLHNFLILRRPDRSLFEPACRDFKDESDAIAYINDQIAKDLRRRASGALGKA